MRDVEVYIKRANQPEYKLSDKMGDGFHILTADVSAPQITPTYQTYAGTDGSRLENITFNQGVLTVDCMISGRRKSDFRLMKSEFYRQLYSRSAFQIRTSLEPSKAMYVVAKPVDIKSENGFSGAVFSMQFDILSGYRHTPFRSDELTEHTDKLQFGMNLSVDNLPIYSHKSGAFTILNPSDIAIDPYTHHHDLKIVVKGIGNSFKLFNKTNGTSVSVNQSLSVGQTYTLNGIVGSIGNNNNIKTDYGHIVLNKGNNEIVITGLSNPETTFSFPFLYF